MDKKFLTLMTILCMALFILTSVSLNAQNLFFTGLGDGTSWEDPNNWNTGTIPTAQDFVAIDGSVFVDITSNAEAKAVLLKGNATLTITTIGQLSLPTDSDDGTPFVIDTIGGLLPIPNDLLVVNDEANFVNAGTLSITGLANDNAIQLSNMASFTNGKTIVISQSGSETIFINNNANFFNAVNATISIQSSGGDAMDMENNAVFTNYGSLWAVDLETEGIDMDDNSTCYNYGSMYFELIDDNDAIDMDDNGTLFENYGTINIVDVIDAGEGVEVDDGVFNNKPTGTITMMNVTGDALRIQDDGTFNNMGHVSIVANPESVDDNSVEIECNGAVFNSGLLEITNNGASDAIEIECSGKFVNEDCGEVDILTNSIIEVLEAEGTFTNNGILTTASTLSNNNNGTFTNNGQIKSNPAFATAPNAVIEGPAVPVEFDAETIGNAGFLGNDFDFINCEANFLITGGGNNAISFTTDNVAFVSQSLCGNVSITAKIENVDPNGYGGLMIRELSDAGAKQVSVYSNLTNIIRHETRLVANGPKQVNPFFKPNSIWLRLERQGDFVFAYHSADGVNFSNIHTVYVPMSNCVEVGMVSFTFNPAQQATAVFSNVNLTGGIVPYTETPSTSEVESVSLKTVPNVYPNPAVDNVTLAFPTTLTNDALINLRNATGQVIEQRELRAGDINSVWHVNPLTDGMYLFEIQQQGQAVQTLRFVKSK